MSKVTMTVVEMTDDLDGSEADESVSFGLDGQDYEIDLSEDNAAALRESLDVYVEAARRVKGPKATRKPLRLAPIRSVSDIRAWATEQGYEVSPRGRISRAIEAAYDDAH